MLLKINLKDEFVCTIIGLISNGALTVFKLFAGITGHSQAMIADALHSLSDGFATGITYIALKAAKRPEDKEHPYGHENIEVIAASMVAIILLLTGLYLGYSAVHTLYHKHYIQPTKIAICAAVISIIFKELLYRYTFSVGNRLKSPVLKANAYDHRSDALSSVGALIGIVGAINGWIFLDPLAGIVISIFIIKMAFDILKESNTIIMDKMPSENFTNEVKNLIETFTEVKSYSNLRFHPVGRHYIVDISICVDRNITILEGHNIATSLKESLVKSNRQLKDIIVHIEPD